MLQSFKNHTRTLVQTRVATLRGNKRDLCIRKNYNIPYITKQFITHMKHGQQNTNTSHLELNFNYNRYVSSLRILRT